MDNFTFYSPTKFVFGKETEKEAGALVKSFGGSRVLIHYGGGSARSGLVDRVKDSLKKAGLYFTELGGVKPNPRSGLVYEGIKLCRDEGIDFILAVGGGSAIDSSKAIAAGVLYDGDFWDFYSGKAGIEKALPVGTVLTIAAAGSEGSGDSVITKEEGMYKRGTGSEALRPKFSILNPELTTTLPAFQTACGITDIMAHLYERYLTNTRDVEVTDRLIEALLITMKNEAPKVMADLKDYQARANIMWAGTMAHTNSCGVGRSQDWNSHNIEHELSALYDCAHGAGLAVTMPSVFRYEMEHDRARFEQAAKRIWGVETAEEGIEAFRNFLISIGMPQTLGDLGGSEEDIPVLVKNLCYDIPVLVKNLCYGDGRDGSISGFVTLNEEDCTKIYQMML